MIVSFINQKPFIFFVKKLILKVLINYSDMIIYLKFFSSVSQYAFSLEVECDVAKKQNRCDGGSIPPRRKFFCFCVDLFMENYCFALIHKINTFCITNKVVQV
jgi:hypothetical protein